jgi:hypothetical protein
MMLTPIVFSELDAILITQSSLVSLMRKVGVSCLLSLAGRLIEMVIRH